MASTQTGCLPGNSSPSKQVTLIVIGAGQRGKTYSNYGLDFPDKLKVVGVADPRKFQRDRLQKNHQIPDENAFSGFSEVFQREKFADAVAICTPDRLHREPALLAAKKGYHILLEKPMDVTADGCREIVSTCAENNVILSVGHVLRYYPPNRTIKELITQGAIGDVVSIQHCEQIGFYHFAHSFVRGNWHREDQSTFCLLEKSCHDLDLVNHWLEGSRCQQLSSFGSLSHFNKSSQPNGAGTRCIECKIEEQCPYSAVKIYLNPALKGVFHSFTQVICDTPDVESVTDAITNGTYGKCVYDCDNDVVSHQVVNMEFSGGQTVSFSMVAFTKDICIRNTKIFGTQGQITYDGKTVQLYEFLSQTNKVISKDFTPNVKTRLMGHNGADFYFMDAFVTSVANYDPSLVVPDHQETLESHLLAFAAEKSRLTKQNVDFIDFVQCKQI